MNPTNQLKHMFVKIIAENASTIIAENAFLVKIMPILDPKFTGISQNIRVHIHFQKYQIPKIQKSRFSKLFLPQNP